ncbi:MAG: FMN-dependent dehydrogenase [Treponema sp.]|nr:MAG: FMN-dependent dehydrogenase [Treponema sp.]
MITHDEITEHSPKCHFCPICDGQGCRGEIPGMGGVFDSCNFIENYNSWNEEISTGENKLPRIRLAPITGAVENIGWKDEKSFYFTILKECADAGMLLSIGDGTPDEKLFYGIEALKKLSQKAAVFIKPYPQDKIVERIERAQEVSEIVGIDIDSYNIVTMRNLVNLEKKNAKQLIEIKKRIKQPLAIKGIFTAEDIQLVKEVKPDIAIISNHGGRIETNKGSTARFLKNHAGELKQHAGELWVDGGLRVRAHLIAAKSMGVTEVMIGRPCITAVFKNETKQLMQKLTGQE